MRILTIRTARDAAAARERLLATADPEATARAEVLLREANPHLDLDHLEAGTLVLVPDAPEFSRDHTEPAGGGALETSITTATEHIEALDARFSAATALASDAREAVLKDLRSRPLRQLEERLPELKPDLDRVRRALAAETRDTPGRRSQFDRVRKQAVEDYEALRQRFG